MILLFISSLERSGSTILDLSLSEYSNVVSLGEVWRVIKPHGDGLASVRDRDCTCGEAVRDCPLWCAVIDEIDGLGQDASLADRYGVLLKHISARYGDDVTVVDSSKSIQALQSVSTLSGVDVRVLYTVRDVRGWMESVEQADKRKKELPWSRIFQPEFRQFRIAYLRHNILRKLPFWLPHEWMIRNERLKKHIGKSGLSSMSMSYEAFMFDTDKVLSGIEKFASLKKASVSDGQSRPELHIVRGNRTAFTSSPGSRRSYNVSWMHRWKWSALFALLPWVAACNKRNVYYFDR